MASFRTSLNENSDFTLLTKEFAPCYSENGQLLSVINFPCIKKFCYNEKKKQKNNSILRKIVLHSSLRAKFNFPQKFKNEELFPCCVCPSHFIDVVQNQLKKGHFPQSYPDNAFTLQTKGSKSALLKTKVGRIFTKYSPILKVLIEHRPQINTESFVQPWSLDDLLSSTSPKFPSEPLCDTSETLYDTSDHSSVTPNLSKKSTPGQESSSTFAESLDNLTEAVAFDASTQGTESSSSSTTFEKTHSQSSSSNIIAVALEESQIILPSNSFHSKINQILDQQSAKNAIPLPKKKNLFTYFDLQTTIQNLKNFVEVDLHLFQKIHSICFCDKNLALEYKNSSQQEFLGTFGNCNIVFSEPRTCIKESKISLSFLLEQEVLHKLSKPQFLLPLFTQASNEFIYRKYLYQTVRLHLEAFISIMDLTPQNSYFIIAEVLEALHHLHGNSIIFNNIQPKSIFVQEHQIKIGNFEFAVLENTNCFQACDLSFPYKSPELANSLPYYCNSDVWSVGILLAFLLSKILHCPFTNNNYDSLALTSPTFIGSDCVYQFSTEAFCFIKHCLTEIPMQRPTSAYFLNHRLLKEKNWF